MLCYGHPSPTPHLFGTCCRSSIWGLVKTFLEKVRIICSLPPTPAPNLSAPPPFPFLLSGTSPPISSCLLLALLLAHQGQQWRSRATLPHSDWAVWRVVLRQTVAALGRFSPLVLHTSLGAGKVWGNLSAAVVPG